MVALLIDRTGSLPSVEVPAGSDLIITRGPECLVVSREVRRAGKIQGIVQEICTMPQEVRIRVIP